MNKELRKQLQEDILDRYDNEEYWDNDIIEAFKHDQSNMNENKLSKCCDFPTYKESGDCGKCGQPNKCDHEWKWNYDCFEDAKIMELDTLGVPVKCSKCGREAVEWWGYSCVKDNNGNIID